jgi:hypothetical protein
MMAVFDLRFDFRSNVERWIISGYVYRGDVFVYVIYLINSHNTI